MSPTATLMALRNPVAVGNASAGLLLLTSGGRRTFSHGSVSSSMPAMHPSMARRPPLRSSNSAASLTAPP